MLTQFHEQAQKAIVIAESIAFDLGHSHVGSEHLLLSVLKMKEIPLTKMLKTYHVDEDVIYKDIVRLFGKKDIQPFYMEYSEVVKKILEEAIRLTHERKESKVTINTLCLALLLQRESVAVELLNKYHVSFNQLKEKLSEKQSLLYELDKIHELINFNERVKNENRLMIGREQELEQLFLTLCKKEKNNVLLIGKAGVGKTALVEKLAYKINQKEVPALLQNKVIYELSLSSIVAGTKYRGEFEEKFKKLIDKVIQAKDAILFIDEIHNLIGAGGAEGAIDASNILKPFLARKDLTLIGATTIEEYYQYFEKDQAMNRRFSILKINENTKEETKDILLGLKKQYENYHHIHIPNERLDEIIDLCDQYLLSRVFPDKALDVLDLSCVKAIFQNEQVLQTCHIEKVIEEISGSCLQESSYLDIEQTLHQHIIGQQEAIHQLVESLESLAQYPHSHRPKGVYLLTGSSGVGKTETAKILAKTLHKHFIKLDMSEYSDATSVNKLIGSSPGYIGFDQQSFLFHDMILYPDSIVLLDEIEKAHPQVMHLFLQVFDEGILKDHQHHILSFKDTIIMMTSNITRQNQPVVGSKKKLQSHQYLESYFSKEFLNRIDEIIEYQPLQKQHLQQILLNQTPIPLTDCMIKDILTNYDCQQGARTLLKEMKKYLVSRNR